MSAPARIELIPPFEQSSAEEILDLARLCSLDLLPWQERALTAMLGETADHQWTAPEVGLVLPRQNGKTYALAARILGGLFILRESLIVFTSHEFKTAIELFRTVDSAARSSQATARMLKPTRWSHGEETIETREGCRFKIMARTRSSGRGFSGDCIILDEALELRDDTAMGALMPTLSARVNPQLIYVSSAGDPGSVVLASVRARALEGGDDELCYIEYSAHPDCDVDDVANWFAANPALAHGAASRADGTLIGLSTVRRERRALSVERFRQERLGIWSAESSTAVIPASAWASGLREVPAPEPGSVAIAFDVTPDRAWSSVAACWRVDYTPHVRLSRHAPGDDWLVDELAALSVAFRCPVTFDDTGPARDIAEQLRLRGVELNPFTLKQATAACAGFLSAVVNQRVTHHADVALEDAAASAGSRRVGEAWMYARRDADKPIAPVIAATLAHWALVAAPPPPPPFRIM